MAKAVPHPEHEQGGLGWKVGTHVVYRKTSAQSAGLPDWLDGMHGIVTGEAGEVLFQDGKIRTPLPWNIEALDEVDEGGHVKSYAQGTFVDNPFLPDELRPRNRTNLSGKHP